MSYRTEEPRALSPSGVRNRWAKRLAVVVGAVAAAVGVWLIAVLLLRVDLLVSPGGMPVQQIGVGAVVVVSLLGGLTGWAVLAALERLSRRGRTIWTIIAVALLVASLAGPITSAVNTAATVILVLMHLIVGVVLIIGLRIAGARPSQAGASL